MVIFLSILLLLVTAVLLYMQHPKFGKAPSGNRLARIKQSPRFKDGKFHNAHFTPMVSEGNSMIKVTYDFIFGNYPRTNPIDEIPAVKTDLKSLSVADNVLIWFGHSSYFIQLDGKRFLIDPVFSGNASPIPGSNRSFNGTDVYSADDMPEIDYLLITHDHYDHLDYQTIIELKPKIKKIVCGLGVGEHFEYWNFGSEQIIEKDWNEILELSENFALHTAPARHFSGRSFKSNNTLWLSFVIQTPNIKIYLGGDSGYDDHFSEIGKKFGGFDFALLDNGQYNPAWREIHLLPLEVLKAAKDLKAKRLLPIHSSKFKLAYHPWDEPLKIISELNEKENEVLLVTPKIGDVVKLNDSSQTFGKWWESIK